MSYYRGDYYRGDYYRGDPFIGGLIAGAVGKAAGRAVSWIGKKVGGSSAGRAAATVAVGSQFLPPVSFGPITVDPRAALPGGKPFVFRKKSRRMNPLNPRALKRALRRAEGFEKFAAKTVNALYRVIDGRKVRTYKKRSRAA